MKMLLLILLSTFCYSQNTTIHFYVSSKLTTGGEIMFQIRGTESKFLGGGFSGAWKIEEVVPGRITKYDLEKEITSKFDEEWCSLYLTGSSGFLGPVLIKYRGGLGVYNQKVTFEDSYTKINKAVYRPLIGISAMYSIIKDLGVEVGVDTFNKATVGFTVNF